MGNKNLEIEPAIVEEQIPHINLVPNQSDETLALAPDTTEEFDPTTHNKWLRFVVRVEDTNNYVEMRGDKFSKVEPMDRLLLAVGHACTLERAKDEQVTFAERIVNKGKVNGSRLSKKQIKGLFKTAYKEGLLNDTGNEFSLDTSAAEKLGLDRFTETSVESEKESVIEPDLHQLLESLDTSEHDEFVKNVEDQRIILGRKSMSHRQVQVLAGVYKNGSVGYQGGVDNKLKESLQINTDGTTLNLAIKRLTTSGMVTLENAKITISEKGILALAMVKTYPDKLIKNFEKSTFGTSYKILEKIAEMTEDEHSKWAFPKNRSESLIMSLCDLLEISETVLSRRLYDLENMKRFVVTEQQSNGRTSIKTNIQLTAEGQKHLQHLRAELSAKNPEETTIPEPELAEEYEILVEAAGRLADQTGASEIAEDLRSKLDEKHPFEYDRDELITEVKQLEGLVDALKYDYVQKFSKAA